MGEHVLVTPSGMSYETLVPQDVVVMDTKGKIIEGERRPSVDTVALLYIYNNMPEANAVIHTHQPYATAVGLVLDELPAFCTTLVNATLGSVTVAPYSSAASLEMGVRTVKHIGDRRAVILRSHGVVALGPTLKDALYAAVYLEDAARSYCAACAIGVPRMLTPEQVDEAVETFRHYGQGKK
jgi:L-ribulose-5-phosphate 4-epimerase